MPRLLLAAAAVLLLGAGGSVHAQSFTATLTGAEEVPANDSPGKGQLKAALDPGTKMLTYTVTYSGLTAPATMAHFHGPAAPGANAPPVVPAPGAANPITGKATLTDAQIADLKAGRWYFNVHTSAHPPGEIRGQVMGAP
jgi:hypothetical protein